MRIISQDGMIDIPYERMVLKCTERMNYSFETDTSEIIGYSITTIPASIYEGELYTLGTYDTKERALEVMKEVRAYYVAVKTFNFKSRDVCSFVKPYFEMPKE